MDVAIALRRPVCNGKAPNFIFDLSYLCPAMKAGVNPMCEKAIASILSLLLPASEYNVEHILTV